MSPKKTHLCGMCGVNQVANANWECGKCRSKPTKSAAVIRASANTRAYRNRLAFEANEDKKESYEILVQLAGSQKKAEKEMKKNRDRAAGGRRFRRSK
jgi:hypothetical protein